MSVLIKGVEMPGNCAGCFMRFSGCEQRIYQERRPKGCPLVEVPTPHGRLIDADGLAELCDIMADKCGGIGESIWGQFKATVEWSPTIIEAEE